MGLEKIGFEVLGVVADDNVINRKAVSLFSNNRDLKIIYPQAMK